MRYLGLAEGPLKLPAVRCRLDGAMARKRPRDRGVGVPTYFD